MMESRGQKRSEAVEEMPADKRACSSLEFRASSSNSSVQAMATNSTRHCASSASWSSRSDSEADKDSAYGSCDSDEMGSVELRQNRSTLHSYQRQRSSSDQVKLKGILSSLAEGNGESVQLAALTELCELLSFCVEDSLSSSMVDSLSHILVQLAKHESNPDIILLAIRAITYLCDAHTRSSNIVVRYEGVSALCQRLMAIEYLDVAEQCLQALEKISYGQPLACLQSGAIMAVLTYIDFFSTSLQRVALSTVANICEKLPPECPPSFMEAVPIMCNLLQYEDRQLVEKVATCLVKVADRVRHSPDMLEELSKHGLIHQATHLINLNGRTKLSQPVYTGLIGLLASLASGSLVAFRELFELNISGVLKDILLTYDVIHGRPSPHLVDGHCNQAEEVLKLLNELLPSTEKNQEHLAADKEAFLVNRVELLRKFGIDLLPVLIQQVINSGIDVFICYGCLAIINKLVYFSKTDLLLEMLKTTNISSFLAGVFSRKDRHVLMLALQTVDTILQKLGDIFLGPFTKEGVFFAIDAILVPENGSQFVFSMFNGIQLSNDSSKESSAKSVQRCLCYYFDAVHSPSNSDLGNCKLANDAVKNLANHIRTSYRPAESLGTESGLTDTLQKLKSLSAMLVDVYEEDFCGVLHQVMTELNGKDSTSTFEFLESGIVKSIVNYLYNGGCSERTTKNVIIPSEIIGKRLELFGRLFFSLNSHFGSCLLSSFIWKLQSALSSVENFPVVLNQSSKPKISYITVPHRRCTPYPCLKIQFVREEGETCLNEYPEHVLTVDPFSTFDAIEEFLWPEVSPNRSRQVKLATVPWSGDGSCSHSPSGSSSPQHQKVDLMESDWVSADAHAVQEDHKFTQSLQGEAANLRECSVESTSLNGADSLVQEQHASLQKDRGSSIVSPEPHSCKEVPSKLLFFLKGEQLDCSQTLYQAIVHQQCKTEHSVIIGAALWNQTIKITYRTASNDNENNLCSSTFDKSRFYGGFTHLSSSLFDSQLASIVERFSSTYDILILLRTLEGMNRFRFRLMARETIHDFAEGRIDSLENLRVSVSGVLQNEFVNSRLSEKLEQQMQDILAVSVGGVPSWCNKLMYSFPFLFSFESRCKYFKLAALGKHQIQCHVSSSFSDSGDLSSRQQNNVISPRKRFLVNRNQILESAAKMMDRHAHQKVVLEVEYDQEVGTGLGPTLEFYTLVSNEFQKRGLGLWREDHVLLSDVECLESEASMVASSGLFPRPWSSKVNVLNDIEFAEVIKKFGLLGQVVAKALHDGRVLDLPFSKGFYKLILGQELTLYDVQSFDSGLGSSLLEFKALVEKKKDLESLRGENSKVGLDLYFRNTKIDDLCLDFTLPGYSDFILTTGDDVEMVTMMNLEEYVQFISDATINTGILRQVDAFKSGFNKVFPISHLQIFTEEELECLLCGERENWNSNDVSDHIKFDHGYTASSPPIINFMEILREFNFESQKAFLRFVTGAPRLPPGGLASLNPKLTVVRKHCGQRADEDLPSVMTCANYLKLPPYSSKEIMREKLLYAITEGQGAFHLS